jgi:hypothetical protein
MQGMRARKPANRQLKRTQTGYTQNGAIASHRDAVPQLRKFFIFDTIEFNNSTGDFSFGHKAINITGASQPLNGIITDYASTYEQYRVKRIRMRCQVGKGFTNDRRIKTYIAARVDVDNQNTTSTLTNLQSLLWSENTSVKTFTERGNVLMADWRPLARISISNNSQPLLNNNLQWYPTNDVGLHTWKGVNVAAVIPETGILPDELNITVSFELDVEFRGRITDASQFSLRTPSIYQTPVISPDMVPENEQTLPEKAALHQQA